MKIPYSMYRHITWSYDMYTHNGVSILGTSGPINEPIQVYGKRFDEDTK